jgi:F-type H+-transporting ATPase subunit gamma
MANLKEVRKRISSTISTQQITKAMKLVSATKLRKAQQGIMQMRPYAEKLQNILINLSGSVDENVQLQKYFKHQEVKKVLLVVISSDRGLCGGFNANVVKATRMLLATSYKDQAAKGNVNILFIGKKANDFFKNTTVGFNRDFMGLFQALEAGKVFEAGQYIIDEFLNGHYHEVRVVYNQFKNAATQIMRVEKMLPVELERFDEKEATPFQADYIFEPSKAEILNDLVPRAVKTQLYKACLDSFASEHGARMVAMDKATENAGELLDNLRLDYNKARQAAITNEISEIVGGAAVLEA